MQVTDLLIAACALEAEAAVLTCDSDFAGVPGWRALRSLDWPRVSKRLPQ